MDRYCDVEAVRVCAEGIVGPEVLARDVWRRYRIALAFTEVHIGCPADEQIRWLSEFWHAALCLRRDGVPLEAVTVWALLGSFDWDSLLTNDSGHYEPGAFDISAGTPQMTELGAALSGLARDGRIYNPALAQAGWWRRPERIVYPPRSRVYGDRNVAYMIASSSR